MSESLNLNAADMQAILSSLLRSRLTGQGQAQYLFADTRLLDAQTPMIAETFGADAPILEETAHALATMLSLTPDAAAEIVAQPTLGAWAQAALETWRPASRELTFMTSGSTGKPVACRQSLGLLQQEILAQADIFTGRRRIVSLVPRHHIYGFLFSILLPKALSAAVAELAPLPSVSLAGSLRPGDLVVAFPLFWKAQARLGAPLPAGIAGVTSTGPCPADTILALLDQGLERMTEVYGSSETGGIGFRHHPAHAYTLLPFWRRHPDHPASMLLRVMPHAGTTWACALPDQVSWDDDRTFRPIKRMDKAVQVAGINVYPDKAAEAIRSHPLVSACTVRLMRPDEGDRLKAFVVPVPGADAESLRRQLKAWLSGKLTPAEIPRSMVFGPELPVNELGKLSDWEIDG